MDLSTFAHFLLKVVSRSPQIKFQHFHHIYFQNNNFRLSWFLFRSCSFPTKQNNHSYGLEQNTAIKYKHVAFIYSKYFIDFEPVSEVNIKRKYFKWLNNQKPRVWILLKNCIYIFQKNSLGFFLPAWGKYMHDCLFYFILFVEEQNYCIYFIQGTIFTFNSPTFRRPEQ